MAAQERAAVNRVLRKFRAYESPSLSFLSGGTSVRSVVSRGTKRNAIPFPLDSINNGENRALRPPRIDRNSERHALCKDASHEGGMQDVCDTLTHRLHKDRITSIRVQCTMHNPVGCRIIVLGPGTNQITVYPFGHNYWRGL